MANKFARSNSVTVDNGDVSLLHAAMIGRGPISDIAVEDDILVVTNFGDNTLSVLDAEALTVRGGVVTGQPFAASAPTIGAPRWDTVIIGLDWDTALLDERLALRTERMFGDGLVEEVVALCARGLREGVTASRALGYAQVLAALDAGAEMAQAQERTFIGTRRYVRRQRSWFRRDHRINWLDGSGAGNVERALLMWQHVS